MYDGQGCGWLGLVGSATLQAFFPAFGTFTASDGGTAAGTLALYRLAWQGRDRYGVSFFLLR
jgi:hypothetical protein